jgi:type II secretion system protein I
MRRGITLLEVLVAAAILAIGLLGAMEVIGRCAHASGQAQDRARAMIFARSKMEEVLKEPVLQIGNERGEGVDESTDYDWEAIVEPSEHPSLVVVTVVVRNRVTDVYEAITALRRPDVTTPPDDGSGAGGLPGDVL